MSPPLKDKVIAITGGASGIGLVTAKLLSSRGATLGISDLNVDSLRSTSDHFTSLGVPFSCTLVDVSKVEQVDAWIASIVTEYGRLDGAVNCAGVVGKRHGVATLTELEDEDWDFVMGVNLRGLMYCLRAELRVIADHGSVVNISSIQGVMARTPGFAGSAAYSASKHGVIGLTRSAAKEVGDREIRVNAVAPGAIWTPMLERVQKQNGTEGIGNPTAIKRIGNAEEIAAIVGFLIGPESGYVTGAVYGGDGGWNC